MIAPVLDPSCGPVSTTMSAILNPGGNDATSYVTFDLSVPQISIDKDSRLSSAIEKQLTVTVFAWYEAHGDSQAISATLNIIEMVCSNAFSTTVDDQVIFIDLDNHLTYQLPFNDNVSSYCAQEMKISGPATSNVLTPFSTVDWIDSQDTGNDWRVTVDATLALVPASDLAGTYIVSSFEGDYSLDHELTVCHL